MSPFYRLKQVWWAVSARPLNSEQQKQIAGLLTPTELELFGRFSTNDQNHSARVLTHLILIGEEAPSLLKAALLHDIGKTRTPLTVVDRSLAVAGKILMTNQVTTWGMLPLQDARRYHRPFVVKEQHAQWGADIVAAAGSDPLTVRLIQRHQDLLIDIASEEDRLLSVLQWADDLS
ncbi:MAG: HD domain-containing protein [Chloroflexota bacterium]